MTDPEISGDNIYTIHPPIQSALDYFKVVPPTPQVIALADVKQKQIDEKEKRAKAEIIHRKEELARVKAQEAYDSVGCNGYIDIGDETCIYIGGGLNSREEVVEHLLQLARIKPSELLEGTDKFCLRPSGSYFNTYFLRERVMAFIGGYMFAAIRDQSPFKLILVRGEGGSESVEKAEGPEVSGHPLKNNNIELAWDLCNLFGIGRMLQVKEVVDELAKQTDKFALYEKLTRLIIRDGLEGKVSIPDALLPRNDEPVGEERVESIVTQLPVGENEDIKNQVTLEETSSTLQNIA